MAKISAMPSKEIISGFKGTIDFYSWKGIPVARKWPVHRPRDRSQEERDTQVLFAFVVRGWNDLSPIVKEAWNRMAVGFPLTGRDLYTRETIHPDLIHLIYEEP